MLLTSCSSIGTNANDSDQSATVTESDKSSSQQLQIIKSNAKFTQEQLLSQIKAEYLLENGGYADSDPIVAIITLPGESLIDSYMSTNALGSVADYAYSEAGKAAQEKIAAEQTALVAELR